MSERKPPDITECPRTGELTARFLVELEELDVADFSVPSEAGRPQTETRSFYTYKCRCEECKGGEYLCQVYYLGNDGKLHTMRGVVDGEDQPEGQPRMWARRTWR